MDTRHAITKRKKDAAAIQKSEANLRTIFNITDNGYMLMDREMNVISFNNVINQWTKNNIGWGLIEGINVSRLVPPGGYTGMVEFVKRAMDGESISFDAPFVNNAGKQIWFHVKFFPVLNEEGENMGCIMSLNDISTVKAAEAERERLTEDLIQRNKDLEQFTYIVSHNLRGPVANIIGSSNLILNEEIDEFEKKLLIRGLILLSIKWIWLSAI